MARHLPIQNSPPTLAQLGNAVAWCRRKARAATYMFDTVLGRIERLRAEIEAIESGPGAPFCAHRVALLEAAILEQKDALEAPRQCRHAAGYRLMALAEVIDAHTTLEERCALFNVNVADRGDLCNDDGVVRLVLLHGLEDSAASRGEGARHGPLFLALRIVFADFLMTAGGQCQIDRIFERGGALQFMFRD